MTAILAYAAPGVAFVASDTKRVSIPGPAIKAHRWSTTVVLAQAGNASQLSSLIGKLATIRPIVGEDLHGMLAAFEACRKYFHDDALAVKAASPNPVSIDSGGTLLVADADSGQVVKLDFSGKLKPAFSSGFETAGVAGIGAAAARHWAHYGPVADNRPQLDMWAMSANSSCTGPTVDWPIDLLITRPKDPMGASSLHRRLDAGWTGLGSLDFAG